MNIRLYRDEDADLAVLADKQIAVLGYGNQGRAQALNLRDSSLDVLVGNREDSYADLARKDGFSVESIPGAAAVAEILMLLIPDEVMPQVFEEQIEPHLDSGKVVVFASGYNIAFELITPPQQVDVALLAPRMIGAGVRDLFLSGQGFPSFVGVDRDASGQAMDIVLALAKGIGSTRAGAVEVTFAQEAELDLFTEQCFGPAFGQVLTSAAALLIDEGYPPAAVLLELYMSGELSYTMGKIAEMGLVEQSSLHSRTSQYGSMTRGMRFILPELREKMAAGLEEIRSGQFAQEWAAEQSAGSPTLEILKDAARSLPLYQHETELRQALGGMRASGVSVLPAGRDRSGPSMPSGEAAPHEQPESKEGWLGGLRPSLRRWWGGRDTEAQSPSAPLSMSAALIEQVLDQFLVDAAGDPALRAFSQGRHLVTHFVLREPELEFHLSFEDGTVSGGLGAPASPADVCLETKTDTLDGMYTGRINAMRAAMTGRLSFSGDTKLAISIQQIQDDLKRLYSAARERIVGS